MQKSGKRRGANPEHPSPHQLPPSECLQVLAVNRFHWIHYLPKFVCIPERRSEESQDQATSWNLSR